MRDNDSLILENLYASIFLKENMSASRFSRLLEPGKNLGTLKSPLMGDAENYTNEDGVEVSIKDDYPPLVELNGEEYVGDIELNYIGVSDLDKRNKGAASRELDRIVKMADDNDLSISLEIDPHNATRGGGTMGISYDQLKKWYESRGFIFDGRSGYRPKKSQNRDEIVPKKMQVSDDQFPEMEKEINEEGERENFPRIWSDSQSMFESYVFRDVSEQKRGYSPYILKGFQAIDGGPIYYYDGINRPIIVSGIKADYDYDSHRVTVKRIEKKINN